MAKKLAILLIVLFFSVCAVTLGYFYFFTTFPNVEEEINLNEAAVKELRIRQTSGLIHVEGEPRDNMQFTVSKIVRPRLPYFATGALAQIGFNVTPQTDALDINITAITSWRGDALVDMQIMAPPSTQVVAELGQGNVNLINLEAGISVTHRGEGTIVLANLSGNVSVVAESAEIRADFIGGDQPVKIDLRNGNLLINMHNPQPGPTNITLSEGAAVFNFHPETNALLTYTSTGTVFVPILSETTPPRPSDGNPVAMKIGQGGAPISIQAGSADLTLAFMTENLPENE